jgi:Polysaccharide lyase
MKFERCLRQALSVVLALLNTFFLSTANGQECKVPSKQALATAMSIDQELVKHLYLEIPTCEHIKLGRGYASFILKSQNPELNNGIRSEIAIDFPFVEGDTIEYRWSIKLPEENTPGGLSNEWWLVTQWHDQPDRRIGETWATFPPQNPPLSIYVEKRNGIVGLGLQGLRGKKLSWTPVPIGSWLKLSLLVRWSTGGHGSATLRLNDGHEFVSLGPNMLNDFQHYFKAGQYRSSTINRAATIDIKDVRFIKVSPKL